MQAINPSFMACHQQDAAREGAFAFALDNHQDLPRTNLILDKHWWVRRVSGKHPLECCKQQRACCTNTYADAKNRVRNSSETYPRECAARAQRT